MQARRLPANEHRRERWRNGLGWTREILREPTGEAWLWRASVAEIDADCTFSEYPGCDRALVLLGGDGLRLIFADGSLQQLAPPHGRADFPGELAPDAVVESRTEVFNLIWRRDAVQAQVLHRPLVGPMVFFPEQDVRWLFFVLQGHAVFKDRPGEPPAEAGDACLLVPEPSAPTRCILDGGGEILLARICRRETL
ncbi:MAG TPA: HutD family protein [Xanthomonadaceae bacterium]|nr:HutD family protein [Xanthomonadaceae bacterium]